MSISIALAALRLALCGAEEEPGAEVGVPAHVVAGAGLVFEEAGHHQAVRAGGFEQAGVEHLVDVSTTKVSKTDSRLAGVGNSVAVAVETWA